ncbi:MAG: hypothetical protein GXO10_00005 [Crenarchaeota archaeon]|nr:hypothetical protein [Thermoproteota archaeon]
MILERALKRLLVFSVLGVPITLSLVVLFFSRISIWFSVINSHIHVPVQELDKMKIMYLTPYLAIAYPSKETLGLFIAVLIILIVVGLTVAFKYVLPAFTLLSEHYSERFETVVSLLKTGILGIAISLLIMIISGILGSLLVPQMFIICMISLLMLALSILITEIGLLLGLLKLGEVTGEDLFKISALINIIGAAMLVAFTFVGAALQITSLILLCLACMRCLGRSKLSGTPTRHHVLSSAEVTSL